MPVAAVVLPAVCCWAALRSWLSPLSSAGTAHLDHQTAEALVRDMLEAAEGRSVLLITHRTEGLVDEVVVMG